MPDVFPKTCQVIHYLVARLPVSPGKTKLVKLVYLADLEARRIRGTPITDMHYRWWRHGPWDEQFDGCVASLRGARAIQVETYPFQGWYGSVYSPLGTIEYSLGSDEVAILNYLVEAYGRKSMTELIEEIVYETPPMKDASERNAYGQALRMEMVDNELLNEHGISLSEILEGERQAESGFAIDVTERAPSGDEVADLLRRCETSRES